MKAEATAGLYDRLESVEGQQEIYRIAAARDRSGKDICQIRNVKSAKGEVLMKDDEIKERWGQYFNMLMNKVNSSVTRFTFCNFWTLKSNILFTILLFSNPSCVCW